MPVINVFKIDSAADTVPLNISDNSNISYKMSNLGDLSDASWQVFGTSVSSTVAWVPGGAPSYEKVYLIAKDAFGNTTATSTVIAPATPANIYYKDITNTVTGDYREFLSWTIYSATTSAAFSKYELYRSTDAINYSLYTTVTDPATNFYTDNSVASSTTYSYKMRYIDIDGDISNYSAVISDKPDGQGGTDITAPIITNVATSTVQSSSAKITWTTDELSDSKVEFSTQAVGNYASSTSVVSFVIAHEVVLTDLTPNTTYVYRVKSKDINTNEATDAGGGAYTFTTGGGPVITSVSCVDAGSNSFAVTWNTDKDSDSVVEYSVYSNLASGQTASGGLVGETASTTSGYQHKLSLSSLNSGTTYYFRVKSTDASSNLTTDDKSGAYYSCATTKDTKPPVISNILTPVIADKTVVIIWTTDEPSTSRVEYGATSAASGSYSSSTALDNTLTRNHVAVVTGLTAVTQYFYRVQSYDMNPDSPTAISAEKNVTTATEKEIITQIVAGGGGGGGTEDKTPPDIGDVSIVDIGSFEATVKFTTSEEATAFVEYGPTSNYGFNVGSVNFSSSHSVRLTGLRMGTKYYLRVKAVDKAGNHSFSLENFHHEIFSELMKDIKDVANVENLYEFQK